MAQSDWQSGTEMVVTVAGVQYPFKTCSHNGKATMVNRSNSKYTSRFGVKIAGQKNATFTAEGPYREGEVPLILGNEYTVETLSSANHVVASMVAILADFNYSNDVEDGPNLAVTFESQGEFNTSVS